jgi:hypothetical protein
VLGEPTVHDPVIVALPVDVAGFEPGIDGPVARAQLPEVFVNGWNASGDPTISPALYWNDRIVPAAVVIPEELRSQNLFIELERIAGFVGIALTERLLGAATKFGKDDITKGV